VTLHGAPTSEQLSREAQVQGRAVVTALLVMRCAVGTNIGMMSALYLGVKCHS